MAVIELASFAPFTEIQQTFLEQLSESIGVVLNTIQANTRTEELLLQSQSLTQDLQSQSEELQAQQDELRRSNAELEAQTATLRASEELLQTQQEELQQTNEELEERSQQLEEQNRRIEIKNAEIEEARKALEEKAEQLALSSKYKSEFLANMSHELRTPLNSLLILAKLLGDNIDGNLTDKQIEFANTIHNAGAELLGLINDILDLSKVEAGKMDLHVAEVSVADELGALERCVRAGRRGEGARVRARLRGERAPDDRHRPAAAPAGAEEPALERVQVHRDGRRRPAGRAGAPGAPVRRRHARERRARGRLLGRGHGRRDRRRQAAPDLRGVPAGGRHDEPPLRRHRARPLDQPRDRPPARRRDPRRVDARRGEHVHALPARPLRRARAGRDRRGHPARGHRRADAGDGGAPRTRRTATSPCSTRSTSRC